jgi:hypothetical protein
MLCEFQVSHGVVNRKYLLECSAMWKGELTPRAVREACMRDHPDSGDGDVLGKFYG